MNTVRYTNFLFGPLSAGHSVMRCCILRGPGWERILDVVPRVTELGTQVKTGSRAGRTHSQ